MNRLTKEIVDEIMNGVVDENYMGYPSAEQYEKIIQQRKAMRKKLDTTKKGDEYYTPMTESPFRLNKGFTFVAKRSVGDIRAGVKYIIAGITGVIGNMLVLVQKVGSSSTTKVKVHSPEEFYSKVLTNEQVARLAEYVKSKSNPIIVERGGVFDYNCIMLGTPLPEWNDIQGYVDEADLYAEDGYGRETEPHITVLYGLHPNEVLFEDVKNIVDNLIEPIEFTIKGISCFEGEEYDVVKLDIESQSLRELNTEFKKLPHTSSYPTYNPHMTIAYVKKGMGKTYESEFQSPITLHSRAFMYSEADGTKYKWNIGDPVKFKTSINEVITIDVKIGDTILMGKFKNKKTVVKSIGKDEHGMPTINGKKVATFRLLNPKNEQTSFVTREQLTEQILWDTFKLLRESGSLDGVIPIPANLADKIIKDFINKIVTPAKVIDASTITGLGSTRAILKKLPTAKKIAGDLDLLAVSSIERSKAVASLASQAKKLGLDYQIAFGNVFSVAYPYDGNKYQVDLMVAEASPDNDVYNYMVKFRFWSDELPDQSTPFTLKGAHRSEIARAIVKAVGLSATERGFSEFMWNNEYDDINKIVDKLNKSASKFRDADKKNETEEIANLIGTKLKSVDRLKGILADDGGFLKNRYPHSMFKNLPKGYVVLVDMIFNKIEGRGNWEAVMDRRFGITNSIDRMHKFDDVINLIKELLKNKLLTPHGVLGAFKEMKNNFNTGKAGMKWSDELESYIETHFKFLKGRW